MIIIGCDYHPGVQQIAWVDTDTGEFQEARLCAAATCGTISQNGIYMAPQTVPKAPTILAEAKADSVGETASAVVTILPPEPSR